VRLAAVNKGGTTALVPWIESLFYFAGEVQARKNQVRIGEAERKAETA
jgi:hypothetical protein